MDETSKSPRACSRCGKPLAVDAPQGLCAACLLLAGTETISQSAGDAPTLWGGDNPAGEGLRLTAGQSFGSYRIGRLLGRGGMGEVYEAEHTTTGRRLALKVLRSRLQSPEERARFLREGQMAASVSHPHTVYIFGSEEISDTPVISMELAPGGTLKDRVATGGPLAPTEAVSAILDIIGGLDAAQAAGILHRDIKPSNCFVDQDGAVKVGDFGLSISTLARDVHQDVAARRFQGTPQFAAPEQLRGEPLDMRADIYAVGATLYYLLTGQPPFDARNWRDLVEKVTAETPQSPRLLRRDVPSGLASVVLMCLLKDPSRRPASYAALAETLRPFSSAAYAPARLGVRFLAGVVDSLILTILVTILAWLAGTPFIGEQTAELALWTGVPLLAYFFFEAHWGATPGKLLLGLRVRSVEGGVASWGQIFWRHLVFDAPSLLLMLPVPIVGAESMNAYFLKNPGMAFVISAVSSAIMGAYFLTARRHNGWAAVHDLLSKTRLVVVRRQSEYQRSHEGSQTAAFSEDDAMPGMPQYGPFTVISESVDLGDGRFLEGFDPALRRRVWIRTVLAGTPTISEARRDTSRRGRLHWLTGRRSAEENWDAYEAPDGSPFLSHQAPTPWPTMKIWLMDLANELWSARRDGTLPGLNLNRIWIRNNGHLLVLDFPADVAASPAKAARSAEDHQEFTPVQLLSSVAERNLSREMSDRDPVPLTARSMIHKWSGSTPIEDARASLLHLSTILDRVTWWRRAMPIALAALPFVLAIGLILWVVPALEQIWTPERWEALTLLTELSGGASLQPRLADPEYRLAVERYLAGRHSAFLRDDAFWEMMPGLMDPRRAVASDIAARHPSVSPDELARAEALISPQLEEWGKLRVEDPALDFGFMGAFTALVVAVWSVISSVLLPGGLVTRALGLAVVTRNGEEIRRWRSVARVLIAWSSAIVWIAWSVGSAPLFAPEMDAPLGLSSWFGMTLAFLPLIAGTVWAIAHPTRGIHDRLAGTWVVPR